MGEALLAAKVGDLLRHTSPWADFFGGLAKGALYSAAFRIMGGGPIGIVLGACAVVALMVLDEEIDNKLDSFLSLFDSGSLDGEIQPSSSFNVRIKGAEAARAAGTIPHDVLIAELSRGTPPDEEPINVEEILTLAVAASAVSASAFLMPGMAASYLVNNASTIYDKAKSFFKMPDDFGFESFFSPVRVTAHPDASDKSDNKITCTKTHIFGPEELFIAQGSKTVLINGQPAARNGDKSTCEAVIDHEQIGPRVRIGGPTVTVRNIKSGKHPWATFAGEMIGSMGKGAIRCLLSGVARNYTKNGLKHALKDFAKTLPKKIGCVFAGQALATGLSVPIFAGLGNIFQSGNPIHYGTGAKLLAEGELDFTLSGRQSIVWQRIYFSRNQFVGLLGEGWRLPFETHLQLVPALDDPDSPIVYFFDATGRELLLGYIPHETPIFFVDEGFSIIRTDKEQYLLVDELGHVSFYARTVNDPNKLVLILESDTFGNVLHYHYDAHGRVHAIDDGTTDWGVEIEYHPLFSRITQVNQRLDEGAGLAPLVCYEYNERAELIKVIDSDGVVLREFDYDITHKKLNKHKLPSGLQATYDYTQLDDDEWYVTLHQLWAEDTELERMTLEYDLTQNTVVTEEKGIGRSVRHFNDARLITQYRNPLGETWHLDWDELDNLTAFTDALGRKTHFKYNEYGNLVETLYPNGETRSTTWHQVLSLPLAITEPNGGTWRYHYNKNAALIRLEAPDGGKTVYQYDETGLCTAQIDALGNKQTYTYDSLGQLTRQTDCSGHMTRYFYHKDGTLNAMSNPNMSSTYFTYTSAKRVSEVKLPDGRARHYAYNDKGQLASVKDFNQTITYFEYDIRGNIQVINKPDGNKIQYHYDTLGHLSQLVNENKRAYHFNYDVLGRLKQQTDLIGQTKHYTYNAASELTELLTVPAEDEYGSKPILTQYEYDTLSRITVETVMNSKVEFKYEKNRVEINRYNRDYALAAQVNYPERTDIKSDIPDWSLLDTLNFDYDIMGRVASETNHAGEFANEYDRLGNLIQTQLPDGARFTHHYYGSGHLLESRFIRGDKNHLLAEYSRDKLHREITRSQGALNLETQYDATGRITRHSLRKTSQSVAFHPLRENRYEYNDVNELISRHILTGDDKSPLTFAKRLSEYFEYDTNGQVLVHSPALEMKYLQEEHYKYDAAGNLITDDFHPPHWTNQTTRHKGQTYHYDGFGRLVQIKQQEKVVKQFEYDEHHRMINSLVKQGKDEWVAQYEYDALSRRISKTSQYYTDVYDHHRTLVEYKSKKQLFYWQGLRLAGESEASRLENRRWYAYEENSYAPLALIDHWHEIDKDEVVYYHNQLNGSPYALSNAQGELVWETETYLWGSYRHPAKNQVTLLYGQPLRFQGQYFDQETGLHYNTFRYYDPETGRFTQQDPIGLAGGLNLYQYAPNPLMWIDPLGWAKCSSSRKPINVRSKSTGRIKPRNKNEKFAFDHVKKHPENGQVIIKAKEIGDPHFKGKGWSKIEQKVNGVNVHYMAKFDKNGNMTHVTDFKFKD
ncbi:RHS repeat-associated core domain-containing protein [Thorsellia anophelis]|uniref:RHS repeat-associated core domain-containing protein n=1 Tax=Thorsellia anophelis DSM 18579 TaxID=1123402 RepID=A0A1I0FMJ0_9GAMM|nr:RHS repeat-associated core domain-containing protein [Thorsellia anophelis]SET59288.1 RHS repeat-associated core domain-containing protein [Thorsellia anophelis DSM 18579]